MYPYFKCYLGVTYIISTVFEIFWYSIFFYLLFMSYLPHSSLGHIMNYLSLCLAIFHLFTLDPLRTFFSRSHICYSYDGIGQLYTIIVMILVARSHREIIDDIIQSPVLRSTLCKNVMPWKRTYEFYARSRVRQNEETLCSGESFTLTHTRKISLSAFAVFCIIFIFLLLSALNNLPFSFQLFFYSTKKKISYSSKPSIINIERKSMHQSSLFRKRYYHFIAFSILRLYQILTEFIHRFYYLLDISSVFLSYGYFILRSDDGQCVNKKYVPRRELLHEV